MLIMATVTLVSGIIFLVENNRRSCYDAYCRNLEHESGNWTPYAAITLADSFVWLLAGILMLHFAINRYCHHEIAPTDQDVLNDDVTNKETQASRQDEESKHPEGDSDPEQGVLCSSSAELQSLTEA